MKKRTIIIISVVAILLLIIIILVDRYENAATTYYWRVVPVERGDVKVIVTATGSIAADTTVDIGVQVSGIIAKIKVDFNDYVKKGQVIAILDTTLYYAARLDAEANLQKAQAAADEAKRELDREKQLLDNKVAAQADYDLSYTSYQTAMGNLISAKAQLNTAVINLNHCTITAPISGMILARNVQVGNMVIASFNSPVLFTIAYNPKQMQVQADVDEADIGQIKVGQKVKFTVDSYPNDVFEGVVTQIRHQPVIVQNVVNYVVIIEVPNPDLKLMPGLTATVNIFIRESDNVLKITTMALAFTPPLTYIQESELLSDSVKRIWIEMLHQISTSIQRQIVEPGTTTGYLWILKGDDIIPVRVTKGLNDGSYTEVSGDIKEGDEVATGINTVPTEAEGSKSKSPFLPKFPSRRR